MLKAVLFDFNGVIVNDEPLHLELFRRVLGEEGIALTEEEYQAKYLGYDNRKCFVAALTHAGRAEQARDEALIAGLMARKMKYYLGAINERFLLFPGVVELVQSLAARYPMAIVSGAMREEIETLLRRGRIRDCFHAIITSDDLRAGKPDPEGYLKALATLNALDAFQANIRPDECLVIEDSIAGVQAAKRAGMRCLAVTNSYGAEELGRIGGADWIVSSLVACDPEALFAL
jgi:HAD superfamily hydrolase (TIGR01509 family)